MKTKTNNPKLDAVIAFYSKSGASVAQIEADLLSSSNAGAFPDARLVASWIFSKASGLDGPKSTKRRVKPSSSNGAQTPTPGNDTDRNGSKPARRGFNRVGNRVGPKE